MLLMILLDKKLLEILKIKDWGWKDWGEERV